MNDKQSLTSAGLGGSPPQRSEPRSLGSAERPLIALKRTKLHNEPFCLIEPIGSVANAQSRLHTDAEHGDFISCRAVQTQKEVPSWNRHSATRSRRRETHSKTTENATAAFENAQKEKHSTRHYCLSRVANWKMHRKTLITGSRVANSKTYGKTLHGIAASRAAFENAQENTPDPFQAEHRSTDKTLSHPAAFSSVVSLVCVECCRFRPVLRVLQVVLSDSSAARASPNPLRVGNDIRRRCPYEAALILVVS